MTAVSKRQASAGSKTAGVVTILVIFTLTALVFGLVSYVLARFMFPWSGVSNMMSRPGTQGRLNDVIEAACRLMGLLTTALVFSPAIPLAVRALVQATKTVKRTVLVTFAGAGVMLAVGIGALTIAEAQVPGAKSFWQLTYVVMILPLLCLCGALTAGAFSGGGWRVGIGTWVGTMLGGAVFWPYQNFLLGNGTEWEGPIWRGAFWLSALSVGGAVGSCFAAAVLMAGRPQPSEGPTASSSTR